MSKSIPGNQKHLTLSDRCFIEQALLQGLSFRQMATTLHKDPSTISKEIKLHRTTPKQTSQNKNDCIHSPKCDVHHICGDYHARNADSRYRRTLSGSRSGINCSPEQLQDLDNLVSPLILKGQPLGHILPPMRMISFVQEELFIITLTNVFW